MARLTIGSPATLNDVLRSTGIPLRRPYTPSSACSRGAIGASSACTRAVPSTCVTAASRSRHSQTAGRQLEIALRVLRAHDRRERAELLARLDVSIESVAHGGRVRRRQ